MFNFKNKRIKKTIKKIFFLVIAIFALVQNSGKNSYAVEPSEFLKNPKEESRARDISKNVRCLVCQNQSIDDSSAPLAKDLRILIRKKISDGETDEQIYTFLQKDMVTLYF